MPDQQPVYLNGKVIGYTSDGKTMTPVPPGRDSSSLWSKANAPLLPEIKVTGEADTNKAISEGRPVAAFMDQLKQGTAQSSMDMLRSLSSPISLALAAASGGESALGDSFPALTKILRMIQLGSGIGFAGQGAKQVVTGKQPGENTPDMLERRLGAALPVVLGTAGTANAIAPTVGKGLRSMGGASDALAEQAARKLAQANQEASISNQAATKSYQGKVADVANSNKSGLSFARQIHESTVADIENENRRAAEAHAASAKRIREANDASRQAVKAGADADSIATHLTQQISEGLPKLAEAVRADARATYPKVEGEIPKSDIYSELKTIVDDKLKGSGNVPTSLAKILNDTEEQKGWGKSTGPTVGGRHFDLSNPSDLKAYQSMKAQGAFTPSEIQRMEGSPGGGISFDDLHGMYSELGRELYRGNLPGDSKAALGAAREYLSKRMTEMANSDGKLEQFNDAQRKWMVYENVFRNTSLKNGSPLARALEYRDPITGALRSQYVRRVLSEPKAYETAYLLLEREYPEMSRELRNSLGIMNRAHVFAKESPKVAKLKPEPNPPSPKSIPSTADLPSLAQQPNRPDMKAIEQFDPSAWRNEQLEATARGQHVRPRDVSTAYRLRYLPAILGIQKLLSSPGIRRWLAYQDLEALQKRLSSIPPGGKP